uniref:DUF6221 family protein n=1 Tax=Arthrobacter silvisoli TaxID=2291022 RepID=UPI003F494537
MNITEFLEARIGEDEAAAKRGGWHNGGGTFANDNYGCLLIQPARVLAECAAKRAIIEDFGWLELSGVPNSPLRAIAAVYADHPDYQQEWAG